MGTISRRSAADWIRLIRSTAAVSDHVRLTQHARQRMKQRKISIREVFDALRKGNLAEPPVPALGFPGHWTVRIADRTGIVVVVGFDPDAVLVVLDVITVMRNH